MRLKFILIFIFALIFYSWANADTYEYKMKWGSYGKGDNQFDNPVDTAVDASRHVYVVDYQNNRIQKFDSDGNFIIKWGSPGTGDGQFHDPFGITVDVSGDVYVSDAYNNRIQKFDSDGTFIVKWGSYGTGDGQFNYPVRVAVDGSDNVYVVDFGNDRIQKFNSDGNFITKWGSPGTGDGQFSGPYGITVDASGNVYVVDYQNNRIQKFNSDGNFITKWGSYGTGDGQFNYPFGITVDASGYVYVSDAYNNRIQKFDSDGNFITKWGSYGAGDGQFNYPDGVVVDVWGYVYVVDYGNNRIQKFGFSNEFRSLYVNITGSGYGVVTSDSPGINCGTDCLGIYYFDTVVNLTVTTDIGSSFTEWSGDADCTDGIVTMNSNISCIATFELLPTLSITKAGSGDGTVISSPFGIDCGADCSKNYLKGTVVSLTATTDIGSSFTEWSGDADCTDGVVTMDFHKSCTAIFDTVQYKLTTSVIPSGNGSINPDCSGGCMYDDGTFVPITANEIEYPLLLSPNDWDNCDDPQGLICIMEMNADKTVTANFGNCMYEARVVGGGYDNSVQGAYDLAGDGSTVQSQATTITEDLFIDDPTDKSVTLQSGYDCTYTSNTGGITTINGDMTISDGTLTIDSGTLKIQQE
jgi:streptogramin lyase